MSLQPYANLSGNSGVTAFEAGSDHIRVEFQHGRAYLYTYASIGRENVERMKELALAGEALATFISTHPEVRDGYVTSK